MKGTRTRDLDVMFLFDSYAPLDVLGVIASLNDDIRATGIDFQLIRADRQQGEWLFASATQTIALSNHPSPLSRSDLEGACNSSYTRAMIPDAADRVARHASHLGITVGCGPAGTQTGSPSLDDFNAAVNIAIIIAMKFMAQREPELIFWGQSSQLVLPRHLAATCDMSTCYPLLIHPLFFSRDRTPGAVPSVGFLTLGAGDILGQEVEFSEVRVPFPEMLELLFIFVGLCETRGRLIGDGETFGNDRHLRLRVRHLNDNGAAPRLRLTIEHHAAYDIGAPLVGAEPVALEPVAAAPIRVPLTAEGETVTAVADRLEPATLVGERPRSVLTQKVATAQSTRMDLIAATRERLAAQSEEENPRASGIRSLFNRIGGGRPH